MKRIFFAIILFSCSLAANAQFAKEPTAKDPTISEPTAKYKEASYDVKEPAANVKVITSQGLPKSNGVSSGDYSVRQFNEGGIAWSIKRFFGKGNGSNGGSSMSGSTGGASRGGKSYSASSINSGSATLPGYKPYTSSSAPFSTTGNTADRNTLVTKKFQGSVQVPSITRYAEGSEQDGDGQSIGNWGTPEDKDTNNEGEGGLGIVDNPIGDAILPLLMMLLGYAAIRSFRKKEENA